MYLFNFFSIINTVVIIVMCIFVDGVVHLKNDLIYTSTSYFGNITMK